MTLSSHSTVTRERMQHKIGMHHNEGYLCAPAAKSCEWLHTYAGLCMFGDLSNLRCGGSRCGACTSASSQPAPDRYKFLHWAAQIVKMSDKMSKVCEGVKQEPATPAGVICMVFVQV